ncbi:MAG: HIT domain-containing protein [Myxococcales bacterium]|nr:HIT domain-containing protein [Myxococcales bacterium]
MPSPFLAMPESAHVAANALAFAVEDRYPVSPGHTLVIPRREVRTWFDATRDEQTAMLDLVDVIKQGLDARSPSPDGYNVGFNAGEVAGQTVMHLHVHVIPRYRGDMDDPRGGVRHVIPSKGNYLAGVGDAPRVVADPAFVEKLLTLLDQGQFTATYKFAVLLGLVDLCMEHATGQGAAPESITTAQLAQKVLALYWPQATAFRGTAAVLRQSSGRLQDAKILSLIRAFRAQHAPDPSTTLARARAAAPAAFAVLAREVEWTLIEMPLPRAQMLSRRGDEDRFLYEINWSVGEPVTRGAFGRGDFDNLIRFRPGAAEQLVALASVVRPVVQRRWAAKVAQLNTNVVEDAQLEEFLFGTTRVSLAPVRAPLIELHDARCFYCSGKLGRDVDVDHFIAWARHPENAVENLVPAHPGCNESKSDHLAAAEHVTRWAERLRVHGHDLDDIARRATWEHDAGRALAVARVIYLRLRPDVRLWQARDTFERADRDALVSALVG